MQRIMVPIATVLLGVGLATHARADDSAPTNPVQVRPFVGAYIPTGKQSDDLKSSMLAGAQVGYELPIPVQLVGTFGWTPSRTKGFSDTRDNIYQYDAGAELVHRSPPTAMWGLSPFIGAGLGARTYHLKSSEANDHTDMAGYGSVGGEFSASRLGARVELRDYVSKFKGVDGVEPSSTRNDLTLTGALTFRI